MEYTGSAQGLVEFLMIDHSGARARQGVVVEHDLVALSITVGEAPRSCNFSGEDGDHLYAAAACAALPRSGDFYRRRRAQLGLAAAGDGGANIRPPRRLNETTKL